MNLKSLLPLFLFLPFSVFLFGQYSGSPAYSSKTTGGNSNIFGQYMEMSCQISGNSGTFRIEGVSGPLDGGTMELREGSASGTVVTTQNISNGQLQAVFDNFNFTHTSGSKDYYARLTATNLQAWTGRMRITYEGSPPTPSTPSNFSVSVLNGSNDIILRWNDVSGETEYKIYRGNSTSSLSLFKTVSANSTSYTDLSTSPNTQYCYRIQACNGNNCSSFSSTICKTTNSNTPSVPSRITASPNTGANNIRVSWNNVTGETGYELHRNVNGGAYSFLEDFSASNVDLIYFDNNVIAGVNYCYRVRACNGNDCSSFTSSDCAEIIDYPDDVTNFSAAIVNTNEVQLTWNAVANITGYRIYRKDPGQNIGVLVNTHNANSTSYLDTDVIPGETYQYAIKAINTSTLSENFTYSDNITVPGMPADITITTPNGGETYNAGQTITIVWSNFYFTGNVNIKYNIDGVWRFADENINNTGTYEWTIPPIAETTNIAKVSVASIYGSIVDESNTFTVNPSGNTNCLFSDITSSHPAYPAVIALCDVGIVNGDGNQTTVRPDDNINKAELAKLIYYGLGLQESPPFATLFPSPFNDLQDNQLWYHHAAKTLSYLEYGDGIAAFERDMFDFFPSAAYKRIEVLKALIEGFNIPLQNSTIPFTDTGLANHPMIGYLETAYSLGFTEVNSGLFRPEEEATRAEVFMMLHQLLNNNNIGIPTIKDDDFFIPGIYTPDNFSRGATVAEGNFKAFGETPFAISGIGLPLVFSFSYNSYWTELPNEFFKMRPLGDGWTHSFNSYLLETEADNEYAKDQILTLMPGGVFQVYDKTSLKPFSKGVYHQLEKIGDKYTITTKSQITYTFEQPNGIYDDGLYLLSSISDRNGNTVSLQYQASLPSGSYRLSQVTGSVGRKLTFTYNGAGNTIRQITDPAGRTVQFTFNNDNNFNVDLLTFKDAKGQNTSFNYFSEIGSEHLIETITLPKGNTITNGYYQRKLVSSQNSAGNAMTIDIPKPTFTNPSEFLHTMVEVTTQDGNTIQHESTFDKLGNLKAQKGSGNDLAINYTDAENEMYPTDVTVNGTSVVYDYDENNGNLLRVTYPNNSYEAYTYTTLNDIKTYRNANGNITTYNYFNGNLTSIEDPMGFTSTINRLTNGLIRNITNPENISQSFAYDNYGNVEKVTLPMGITSSATYDILGRLQTTTNANNQTMSYQYDDNDNLIQEINALGSTKGKTTYTYDRNDNLTTITNAKGKTTALNYEFETDFLKEVTFGDATDKYEYDKDGRIKKFTKPSGMAFNYTYDNNRRLTNDGYAGFTYQADNLIDEVSNTTGTIKYAYDILKRVESITFDNQTIGYKYDNVGNLVELIYPGSKTVYYTYDKNNRLTKVRDWNNQETNYTYRKDGALLTIQYSNGITTSYTYDALGRIKSCNAAGNNPLYSYNFSIDPLGNHLNENYTAPFIQLSGFAENSTDYSYNDENEILDAGTISFTYDADGRITRKGTTQFTYDKKDRLLNANVSGQNLSYTYDGLGNRRSRTENGTTTKYFLDILGMSRVLIETDVNNNPQEYYVYGLGLISRVDANNNTRYYHFDHRGSTVAMTDENQNITHNYFYDDFGYSLQTQEEDFNPFRYVGMYGVMYEKEDLQFMRARFYDAEVGRFLSEDPIWNSNLFNYVEGNPINGIDPLGLFKIEDTKNGTGAIFDYENGYSSRIEAIAIIDKPGRKRISIAEFGIIEGEDLNIRQRVSTLDVNYRAFAENGEIGTQLGAHASLYEGEADATLNLPFIDIKASGNYCAACVGGEIKARGFAKDGKIGFEIGGKAAKVVGAGTNISVNFNSNIKDSDPWKLGRWLGGKIYDITH